MTVTRARIDALDWFCGAGGTSTGVLATGKYKIIVAANHWDRAVETHSDNHPQIDHWLADLQEIDPAKMPAARVLFSTPECFPGGTLILTRRGLVPIEDVIVGDEVITHRQRWRKVTDTMQTTADTVVLKGQGHYGLELTANHRLWARSKPPARKRDTMRRLPAPCITCGEPAAEHGHIPGYAGLYCTPKGSACQIAERRRRRHELTEPEWTPAESMVGRYWATPTTFEDAGPIPVITGRGMDTARLEFWWLIGRWLGDGWLRVARGEVHIVCGYHEEPELVAALSQWAPPAGRRARFDELNWQRNDTDTAADYGAAHGGFAEWLLTHFGQHAHGKTLPAWALTMDEKYRRALLTGYLSADGSEAQRTLVGQANSNHRATSTSRRLALGMRLLAETLGLSTSFHHYPVAETAVIEGRTIRQRPAYTIKWEDHLRRAPKAPVVAGQRFAKVQSSVEGRRAVAVYNITVDEDHSYIADGIVVKNCTNHSGSNALRLYQQGPSFFDTEEWNADPTYLAQERSRATMSCSLRYAEAHKPEFVVHENVVEVAWWGIEIPGKKRGDGTTYQWWRKEWDKLGYEVHELFLNSATFGAPQLRDRFIIVCRRKDVPKPNFDFTPACWCPQCERVVEGRQRFRKRTKAWPLDAWGRLGRQYDFVCYACKAVAQLIAPGAYTVIDWSDLGDTIGERASAGSPLAETTLERVRRGFTKWADEAWVMPCRTKEYGAESSVGRPLLTLTGRQDKALVVPAFFLKNYGRADEAKYRSHPITDQLGAITTSDSHSVVTPPQGAMIVELRNGGSAKSAQRSVALPLGTIAAAGLHHSVVIPPAMFAKNNGQADDTVYHPAGDPLGTVTCGDTTSLVSLPNAFLAPYYSTGVASHVADPAPTVTTHDRFGLATLRTSVDLDDVHFRMLAPRELQAAQTFPDTYRIAGTQREKTRQIGDAVPCVLAEAVAGRIAEALEGAA